MLALGRVPPNMKRLDPQFWARANCSIKCRCTVPLVFASIVATPSASQSTAPHGLRQRRRTFATRLHHLLMASSGRSRGRPQTAHGHRHMRPQRCLVPVRHAEPGDLWASAAFALPATGPAQRSGAERLLPSDPCQGAPSQTRVGRPS